MSNPSPTQREYQALAAFRLELRRFFAFSASAAAEVGIAPQQYQALLAIKGHAGEVSPSISDLAAQLLVQQHTAVELVKRLEASGLVTRRRSSNDRRVVQLALTAAAEAVLASLASIHLEELRRSAPVLSALIANFGDPSTPQSRNGE